jgi:hypothetical protein
MKPDSPKKEQSMSVNTVSTAKVASASAIGAAAGTIISLVALSYAFKVPKELKRYLPKNDTETTK